MDLIIKEEKVKLLAEKALVVNSKLIVSDLHLGKASTFRQSGLAVPESSSWYDLNIIINLCQKNKIEEIIFLGDIIHSKCYSKTNILQSIKEFKQSVDNIALSLTIGNHDKNIEELDNILNFKNIVDYIDYYDFRFTHEFKDDLIDSSKYMITGHLHPSVLIKDKLGSVRIPCFYMKSNHMVVPAFGSFTGKFTIKPKSNEKVFVIADNKVIDFGR
jgi:DNA ligase-associated metallophosphoesterase